MKIWNLYIHFRIQGFRFIRIAEDMWQLRLGVINISRMPSDYVHKVEPEEPAIPSAAEELNERRILP